MAKAKVVSEFYRLTNPGGEVLKTFTPGAEWMEIYWSAMDAIRSGVYSVTIQRVTRWSVNVEDLTDEDRLSYSFLFLEADQTEGPFKGETVTGEYKVTIPRHFPGELSRVHVVNGWVVPETIEV